MSCCCYFSHYTVRVCVHNIFKRESKGRKGKRNDGLFSLQMGKVFFPSSLFSSFSLYLFCYPNVGNPIPLFPTHLFPFISYSQTQNNHMRIADPYDLLHPETGYFKCCRTHFARLFIWIDIE